MRRKGSKRRLPRARVVFVARSCRLRRRPRAFAARPDQGAAAPFPPETRNDRRPRRIASRRRSRSLARPDPADRHGLLGLEDPAQRGRARPVHRSSADGPQTGAALADALGLHPRATADFLDTLVALGLLERDGDGAAARYCNTPADRALPRPRQPALRRRHPRDGQRPPLPLLGRPHRRRCRPASRRTRSSTTASRCSTSSTPIRSGSSSSCARWPASRAGNFEAFAEKFDFAPFATPCRHRRRHRPARRRSSQARHPHLAARSLDLPVVRPIAERHIKAAGLEDRVDRRRDRLLRTSRFPRRTSITMGMILHDWNLEHKKMLIAKAYRRPARGRRLRRDREHHRRCPARECVRPDDVAEHADRVRRRLRLHRRGLHAPGASRPGFSRCEILPLAGGASAAIAWK